VARHIFQACPVWIYTQSNITSILFNWVHYTNTANIMVVRLHWYRRNQTRSPPFPPWPGIFFKPARCGYTLHLFKNHFTISKISLLLKWWKKSRKVRQIWGKCIIDPKRNRASLHCRKIWASFQEYPAWKYLLHIYV
jgi:hypothetical protein